MSGTSDVRTATRSILCITNHWLSHEASDQPLADIFTRNATSESPKERTTKMLSNNLVTLIQQPTNLQFDSTTCQNQHLQTKV